MCVYFQSGRIHILVNGFELTTPPPPASVACSRVCMIKVCVCLCVRVHVFVGFVHHSRSVSISRCDGNGDRRRMRQHLHRTRSQLADSDRLMTVSLYFTINLPGYIPNCIVWLVWGIALFFLKLLIREKPKTTQRVVQQAQLILIRLLTLDSHLSSIILP